jgi:GntR family transcriptional regulator / MocR family aminotransferase
MPADWTRDAPDLMIALDRTGIPLALQIQEQLRVAIREGRLLGGERLPSTRRLADHLGISRGTVVEVYEQLVAEGYVDSAVGSGTRVARIPGVERRDRPSAPPAAAARPTFEIDFEYGIPDLGSVPLRDWVWAVGEATRTLPTAGLGDEEPAGSRHLREVVTAYHRRVRAGCATADDVVVVGGFRQGLTFTLATLARCGIEALALEDPGPREHDIIARRAGLTVVPVRVDAEGLNVAALRASQARAVLVTPAHQCPTGVALSPSRRRELVAWAHEVDGVILEDDYDAEFRYDREPVWALQGLAADHVVQLGTVSKTLAPALRLGWLIAPDALVDDLERAKRLVDDFSPALDQLALAGLIASGEYDRHLRRARSVYRRRRDTLVSCLAAQLPELAVEGIAAGVHLLLRLPRGSDDAAIVAEAATAQIIVQPLSHSYVNATQERGLVIGYGRLHESAVEGAIKALARIVRRHL